MGGGVVEASARRGERGERRERERERERAHNPLRVPPSQRFIDRFSSQGLVCVHSVYSCLSFTTSIHIPLPFISAWLGYLKLSPPPLPYALTSSIPITSWGFIPFFFFFFFFG